MSLPLILALQAATAGETDPAARDFDLRNVGTARTFQASPASVAECREDAPDEIVVCGSRSGSERDRLRPLPPGFETRPLLAEIGLGGVSARMHVDAAQLPNGMISKRIMITFTMPF